MSTMSRHNSEISGITNWITIVQFFMFNIFFVLINNKHLEFHRILTETRCDPVGKRKQTKESGQLTKRSKKVGDICAWLKAKSKKWSNENATCECEKPTLDIS